jgi:succinyl-CoA synthetase alpha subunit
VERIAAHEGLLAHLIRSVRPDLGDVIAETGRVETAVVGLGGQGTRHAGLMREFGTHVTAGISPDRGGERIHETIPVYDDVTSCLADHPNLAAVSIWRHLSSARDAALEAIGAGIPLVVLITEGIPLRDVRDILAAARARGTLLIGGNTPGVIFPPEGIKIGMLPNVFHAAEPEPGRCGPNGVTILSRSGAILYHMSDALASAGIAQNGVLGVGGDGAIGSTFRQLVPLVMAHEHTDLVVVAGEIGGAQEELLAKEIREHAQVYSKPLVALVSGNRAPAGKTMGHAGAIVAPGQEYGTFRSKRRALEEAGVTVVNSQYDLIETVREALGGKSYFDPARYHERMRETWEAAPPPKGWGTRITKVEPNRLTVAGRLLEDVVESAGLLEAAYLLLRHDFPEGPVYRELEAAAVEAVRRDAPDAAMREGEQLSTALARWILLDEDLAAETLPEEKRPEHVARALGRVVRFLARALGQEEALDAAPWDATFAHLIAAAAGAGDKPSPETVRLIQAMAVASIDHGVTPPSAQATVVAASVRAPYEMALASGLGAITDVHGGAGQRAAEFFRSCTDRAKSENIPLEEAATAQVAAAVRSGRRIAGLGHRIHNLDPRRDVLWRMADEARASGACVEVSRIVEDLFEECRGFRLPINVDGVIGAIAADLGLHAMAAKALFILGRVAGLSAHYFEEVTTQPPMRRIRFDEAVYRGPEAGSE